MQVNRLRLNPSKTEFLWCATSRRSHCISAESFTLADGNVKPVNRVCNLGAFFDSDMNMRSHVNRLVSSCYYQMRRIRSIRRSLPTSMAITLMNSFIIARVDYCNSLFAGLPVYQIDRIQTVLNDAARLIFGGFRRDHVTSVLCDRLHWLRAPQRIQFTSLQGQQQPSSRLRYHLLDRRSTLRSADKAILIKPKTRTEFGKKSFSYAGPHQWNQLPLCVRHMQDRISGISYHCVSDNHNVSTFKKPGLKHFCFLSLTVIN